MQSGQVSVWVPIVVGVIGLVGVIAGQLVNAWRERRREDTRWRREQAEKSAQQKHDDMIHWRETRLRIYSEFLWEIAEIEHALTKLHRISLGHDQDVTTDHVQQFFDSVELSFSKLNQKTQEIALVAPSENLGKIRDGLGEMIDGFDSKNFPGSIRAIQRYRATFSAIARLDLGSASGKIDRTPEM